MRFNVANGFSDFSSRKPENRADFLHFLHFTSKLIRPYLESDKCTLCLCSKTFMIVAVLPICSKCFCVLISGTKLSRLSDSTVRDRMMHPRIRRSSFSSFSLCSHPSDQRQGFKTNCQNDPQVYPTWLYRPVCHIAHSVWRIQCERNLRILGVRSGTGTFSFGPAMARLERR